MIDRICSTEKSLNIVPVLTYQDMLLFCQHTDFQNPDSSHQQILCQIQMRAISQQTMFLFNLLVIHPSHSHIPTNHPEQTEIIFKHSIVLSQTVVKSQLWSFSDCCGQMRTSSKHNRKIIQIKWHYYSIIQNYAVAGLVWLKLD